MIFQVFPGVVSFFQVFQVEWEPCLTIFPNSPTFDGLMTDNPLYLSIGAFFLHRKTTPLTTLLTTVHVNTIFSVRNC